MHTAKMPATKSQVHAAQDALSRHSTHAAIGQPIDLALFYITHTGFDPHDYQQRLRLKPCIGFILRAHASLPNLDAFVMQTDWLQMWPIMPNAIGTTGDSPIDSSHVKHVADWYAEELQREGAFRASVAAVPHAHAAYAVWARPMQNIDLTHALLRYGRLEKR